MKTLKKLFSNIYNVMEAVGAALVFIAGVAAYIFFKSKQNDKLDEKIEEAEDEIIKKEAIIDYNNENIAKLDKEEAEIESKIKEIEEKENDESVEDFFDKRGL